ncbi:hypothetical protein HDU85_006249 [Gaertneriomyces sp. JEL0708]|nr:hypothetical protein HDU85_006249 [Gaertneriomyces sp. JEL0708]
MSTASPWQACFDESSQLWYWWNTSTNETTWDDPTKPKDSSDEPADADSQRALRTEEEEEQQAPSDEEVDAVKPLPSRSVKPGNAPPVPLDDRPPTSERDEIKEEDHVTTAEQGKETSADEKDDAAVGKETEGEPAPATPAGEGVTADSYADFYNSKEYYDWYYSQYDNASSSAATESAKAATAPPPQWMQPQPPVTGRVDYSDYTVTGGFNPRTGRFQNIDRDPRFAAPEQYFDQYSKSARQMNFFFDYEKYQEERAAKRLAEMQEGGPKKQPKLTKKDIEHYKQKKKQKKLRNLLAKFGDD